MPCVLAEDGEERELHAVRRLEPDVAIVPRCRDGVCELRRADVSETCRARLAVVHLERDAHGSGCSPADLDPVDLRGLTLVDELERGAAGVEDRDLATLALPCLE